MLHFTEGEEIKSQLTKLMELLIKTDSFKDGLIALRYKLMLNTSQKGTDISRIIRKAGLKVRCFPKSY